MKEYENLKPEEGIKLVVVKSYPSGIDVYSGVTYSIKEKINKDCKQ